MLQDLLPTFVAFQEYAQHFDSLVLIATGIGLIVVGLVIWLAGTMLSRLMSAIIGGLVAFTAAIALTGGALSASILACTTGAIVGAVLRRLVLAIVAAILVGACLVVVLSSATDIQMRMPLTSPDPDSPNLTAGESWQRTVSFARELRENVIEIGAEQHFLIYVAAIGAAIVAFAVTFYFRNFGAAFTCSAIGTIMALSGMVTLLYYKGSRPVNLISDNAMLAVCVSGGMVLFGILVQMLLGRPRKGKTIASSQAPAKRLDQAEAPAQKEQTISLKPSNG